MVVRRTKRDLIRIKLVELGYHSDDMYDDILQLIQDFKEIRKANKKRKKILRKANLLKF